MYWRPVFNILEGNFEVILVNAQHMKAVPGKKTDTLDCQWIADLLRHGLLAASFIPPKAIRDLARSSPFSQELGSTTRTVYQSCTKGPGDSQH